MTPEQMKKIYEALRAASIAAEEGIEIEIERSGMPSEPQFPVIFFAAVIKDALDLFLSFAALGFFYVGFLFVAISWMVSGLFAIAILIWMFDKVGFVQKRVVRSLMRRFFMFMGLEAILPFVPWSSIFVLFAHNREKKAVRLFLEAASRLELTIK